jgi:hypothetical protein
MINTIEELIENAKIEYKNGKQVGSYCRKKQILWNIGYFIDNKIGLPSDESLLLLIELMKQEEIKEAEELERRVELFVEKWDEKDISIYEEYEAMNILEEESEEFVNSVIGRVDRGNRIGNSLYNFEFDEIKQKWVYRK